MKIKNIASAICLFFLFLNPALSQTTTAAILPQGKTQFLDNNGNPLSSGKVFFYIPNTTTFKTTWQDAAETTPNANPVVLDAGGRAIIYGSGSYRQRVFNSSNLLIYDAVTASTGTGGSTPTAFGDGSAVGTIKTWAGLVPPANYVFSYGQELSRTTYSALLSAITLTQTFTCTSGSPILTNLSDTSQLPNSAVLETTCVPAGSFVIGKTSTTVTMNNNASLNTSTSGVFFLYGNGNGSTTFNVPDLRGWYVAGRCNMGGTPCSTLNISNFNGNPNATGGVGGSSFITLLTANLPPYTPTGTVVAAGTVSAPTISTTTTLSGAATNAVNGSTGVSANLTGGGGALQQATITAGSVSSSSVPIFTNSGSAFTGNAQGGSSTPISPLPPTRTLNYIIKILPDINLSIPNVVTSLGGMIGDIGCGPGLTCAGNTISTNLGTMAAQNANAVAITGGSITGMPNPTLGSDVATKSYVDSFASGIIIHPPVNYATAAILPNSPTYANGASGVGATLSATTNGAIVVDGSNPTIGQRILVKNQASAFQNGTYDVTIVGTGGTGYVLTRSTDFDTSSEMIAGAYFLVLSGTTNINKPFVLSASVATVGTNSVTFFLYSNSTTIVGTSVITGGSNGKLLYDANGILGETPQQAIDIRTFGATCNGTDQNTAVQAVLSTGAKQVFIPSGCTWVVPGGAVPAGLIIRGEDSSSTGSVIKSNANPTLAVMTIGAGTELISLNVQGASVNTPTNCPMHRVINVSLTTMQIISTCYSSWDQQSGENGVDRTGVFFKVGSMASAGTGDALNVSNCGGNSGCLFTGNSIRADNYSGVAGVAAVYGTAMLGSGNGIPIFQSTNNGSNSPIHYAIFDPGRTGGSMIQANHRTTAWTTGDFIHLDAADISGSFTANFATLINAGTIRWQVDSNGATKSVSGFYNINSSGALQSFLADNGTAVYVSSNGAGTAGVIMNHGATSWSALSDFRLKKNIKTFSVLNRLQDFRAVGYDLKDSGRHEVGVIAQELEKSFPELVNRPENPDDSYSVTYDRIGPVALMGVKELKDIVIDLTNRIKVLETVNKSLKRKMK